MKAALSNFLTLPLKVAARQLLAKLGYKSDKFIAGAASSPSAFLDLFGSGHAFDQSKALFHEWKSADLLFQLTDQELSRESSLFPDTSVQAGLLQSYLFFAIELKGSDYARGKFSAIARQINRLFPMPVMALFKHHGRLTIAVINRRRNKLESDKDVLEKATLIRDINVTQTHRGHLDILDSLALPNLVHPQKKPITDFDTLHAAWEQIFNVELLNERFYKELANWYFWALPQVEFPADLDPDDEKRRATGLIRLLTRLIFCWFLKEKDLIPEKLFHPADLAKILKGFDPESETSSTYYQAILQNLFFATLNQRMGKDGNGKPYRVFAKDEGFQKNRSTYDVNNLYRYEALFQEPPEAALAHFADIPFLNGGLFECLDRTEEETEKKRYLDGFSRNVKKRPTVPNELFFGAERIVDLSTPYNDTKRRKENVTGLIRILDRYKFTILENTPIDQEIALDPELLGKVFENLLASYNEETKTTARKQTGSFYTPRPIVDYMVDESLKAHLKAKLEAVTPSRQKVAGGSPSPGGEGRGEGGRSAIQEKLDDLFAYTEKTHAFTPAEVACLIAAIDALKILDPACGSGAFPMGVLHKLVTILGKLDPDNDRWKQTQLAKLDSAPMREELERAFADNNDDYGRKLYLIENCLYGVDIQPIAIQITKLRFFISLVCDQKTNRSKKDNHGIRPLPNLETKFVAADTLIGLPEMNQMELVDPRVYKIEAEIETLYHSHFSEQRRERKLANQRKVKVLRKEMADVLAQSLMSRKKSEHIAEWDPFDPQSSADFFDSHWMFGKSLAGGFDIVIGNPPYGATLTETARAYVKKTYKHQDYQLDTYLLFLERGISLLRQDGIQSFIVPNTWLPSIMFKSIRRFIFSQTRLNSLVDIRTAVFAAVVDNNIITHSKSAPEANRFPVVAYTEVGFAPLYIQNQEAWHSVEGNTVSVALTPKLDLIADVIRQHETLDHFFTITPDCKPYQVGKGSPKQTREIVSAKPFTSEKQESPQFRPLLRGRLITQYKILWNKDLWIDFGEWLAEPRESAQYDADEKIVIRQTGDSLIAALDSRQFVVMNNMFTIVPNSRTSPLRFALSAINSSVLNWYYQNCINPEKGEALAEVKKGHLTQLPLAVPSPEKLRMFDALVSCCFGNCV
ncbi:MAG: Eco57I restriction-modification methylase domain-containing protein [Verrucomicrobia bacterium]|nr:Eco57I restriction-modification methylase domain-containing protein [Verrucomicrobiota bacterium]